VAAPQACGTGRGGRRDRAEHVGRASRDQWRRSTAEPAADEQARRDGQPAARRRRRSCSASCDGGRSVRAARAGEDASLRAPAARGGAARRRAKRAALEVVEKVLTEQRTGSAVLSRHLIAISVSKQSFRRELVRTLEGSSAFARGDARFSANRWRRGCRRAWIVAIGSSPKR
jgi:hypothetical protein